MSMTLLVLLSWSDPLCFSENHQNVTIIYRIIYFLFFLFTSIIKYIMLNHDNIFLLCHTDKVIWLPTTTKLYQLCFAENKVVICTTRLGNFTLVCYSVHNKWIMLWHLFSIIARSLSLSGVGIWGSGCAPFFSAWKAAVIFPVSFPSFSACYAHSRNATHGKLRLEVSTQTRLTVFWSSTIRMAEYVLSQSQEKQKSSKTHINRS